MKAIIAKFFIVIPLILFVDYIIMALLGCLTCLFGFGDEFYCGPFCLTGKILLVISATGIFYILQPELKLLLKNFGRIFQKPD